MKNNPTSSLRQSSRGFRAAFLASIVTPAVLAACSAPTPSQDGPTGIEGIEATLSPEAVCSIKDPQPGCTVPKQPPLPWEEYDTVSFTAESDVNAFSATIGFLTPRGAEATTVKVTGLVGGVVTTLSQTDAASVSHSFTFDGLTPGSVDHYDVWMVVSGVLTDVEPKVPFTTPPLTTDGTLGEPCFVDLTCATGEWDLTCNLATYQCDPGCGAVGQHCCAATTAGSNGTCLPQYLPGLTCDGNGPSTVCNSCGLSGQECCNVDPNTNLGTCLNSDRTCAGGYNTPNGTECVECGQQGEQPCPNGCAAGLVSTEGGVCEVQLCASGQGGLHQPCCAPPSPGGDPTCTPGTGYACQGGLLGIAGDVCVPAGEGIPAHGTGSACPANQQMNCSIDNCPMGFTPGGYTSVQSCGISGNNSTLCIPICHTFTTCLGSCPAGSTGSTQSFQASCVIDSDNGNGQNAITCTQD
jgi:hypothetical protein